MPECYEIKVKDYLDQCGSDWFAGMKVTQISVSTDGLFTQDSDKEE